MTLTRLAFGLAAAGFGAGGVLALLAPSPRTARLVTAIGAAIGCGGGLIASAAVLATGTPIAVSAAGVLTVAGGLVIVLDRLGAVFLALVAGIGLLAAVYGASYTAEYDRRGGLGGFGLLFNVFLFGMSLVVCAGNVFTFLLAWELMAVSSYLLVMTDADDAEVRTAGLWYAAMTHVGLVLLLPMFLLMAPAPGATTFADLGVGAALLSPAGRNVVFVLALVAFGSKAGVIPLHVWLPRAHPAAPSHVSALMSGVMIKLGIYGLLRVSIGLLGGGPVWWGGSVLVIGSLSALGGILYALADTDLKRLLAYSSVENVGVILLGVGAGLVFRSYGLETLALVAFGAALLHTINHACFKALLFLGAGSVLQAAHTRNMEHLGGLIKGMPQTAALFLIGSAAAAALPPLNGFASEWTIVQSLLAGARLPPPGGAVGTPLAVGVLALTSGLAAACFVKAFGISFLAMPRTEAAARARDPHWSARVAMGLLAAGCVVSGVAAPRLLGALESFVGAPLAPHAAIPRAATAPLWLTAPGGLSQVSPLLLAVLLLTVAGAAVVLVRARRLDIRRADTWGCGRIRQTPRMEYTAAAFAEPLRRIFAELYRPSQDLSVSVHPASRYVVRSITYTSRVVPWIEAAVYDPLVRGTRAVAMQVRRVQGGSIHLYLLYVAAALMLALAATWWAR